MRLWNRYKSILNNIKEWFALLSVFKQLGFVTFVGFFVVLLSSLFVGSIENSYLLFIDPPALALMKDEPLRLVYSFFLMLFGIVIAGFVISVLSSWLENIFRDIRGGMLAYHGVDHTLIVNYNPKIEKILEELDKLHEDQKDIHEVVILAGHEKDIEKLQQHLHTANYRSIKIYVRFGDVLSYERYKSLSILNVYAIIVLQDCNIEDPFVQDNNNIRIVNLLFYKKEFEHYLRTKLVAHKPVKAVVELSECVHAGDIVAKSTHSLFLPLAPETILSNILNLSMINIDYYNIWSELLSFEGHEFYFIDPARHNLIGERYRDIVLRREEGLLVGISRSVGGEFSLLLNALDATITQNDWLLFIASDRHRIAFKELPFKQEHRFKIEQPKEIFVKNILVLGAKRAIDANELLDMQHSKLTYLNPEASTLFEKEFFDAWLYEGERESSIDAVILNLEDELLYRIALHLKSFYDDRVLEKFVFLIDDPIVSEHLAHSGIKNRILSDLLVAKYMTQISNQVSLNKVFALLFAKEDAEVNLIETQTLARELLEDVALLEFELVQNKMTYLGVVNDRREVVFEARDLNNAAKIIVLSNGDF